MLPETLTGRGLLLCAICSMPLKDHHGIWHVTARTSASRARDVPYTPSLKAAKHAAKLERKAAARRIHVTDKHLGTLCGVADCDRAVSALGMCTAHYWRDLRHRRTRDPIIGTSSCVTCRAPLAGRADRRYCSPSCRQSSYRARARSRVPSEAI